MRLARLLATAVGLWFLPVISASAMTVTPVHLEMSSAGSASRAQFSVTNDSKDPLPVEIVIDSMTLSEDGSRQLKRSSDNFLILPPQALIQPGASQVFRVQWVGEPDIKTSVSFMASANQIPVKLPKGQSGVQIVMSFGVVINVAPPAGKPALQLVSSGIESDRKTGKRFPTVVIHNPSVVHGLLPESTLRLSAGTWSHTFSPAEMREKIGIGLVQPGKRRKFVLPVDLPPNVTKVEATLDYKPKRN